MDLSEPRSIHVIGVAGSVMGGVSCMLSELGHRVRGSDGHCYPPMSDRLAAADIPVTLGFDASNVSNEPPDLVLVGNITRRDNPEAVEMRRLGLAHMSLPELLGELVLDKRRTLTVAGTHGKTTTSTLLTWLLVEAGLDPGYMIGGVPVDLESGLERGGGHCFVLEADEYDTAYFDKRPKLVHYKPAAGILTSVEFDHADIYRDFDEVRRAFRTYARLFEPDGTLWVHAAGAEAVAAAGAGWVETRRYGIEGEAADLDACARDVVLARGSEPTRFRLELLGETLGTFELPMCGRHNVWNAVAALAIAAGEGANVERLRHALARFGGVRRRQELHGRPRGIDVIQDYAHHPTAVRETLAAMRALHPERRLWALFEAESNTSRRNLFQEAYVEAFADADEVIFVRPLAKDDSLAPADRLDPDRLASDLSERGIRARFIPDPDAILETLLAELVTGDVALFMSGRNFLGLPARLHEALRL